MPIFKFNAQQVAQVLSDLECVEPGRGMSCDPQTVRATSLLLVISRGVFISSDAVVNGRIMARRAYAIGCNPDCDPHWKDTLEGLAPGLETLSQQWAQSLIQRGDETLQIELTPETLRLLG